LELKRKISSGLWSTECRNTGGLIDTDNQQVYIRLDGALDTVDKIRNTPIVEGGRNDEALGHCRRQARLRGPCHLSGPPQWGTGPDAGRGHAGSVQRFGFGKALEAEQSKLQKALPVGFTFEKVIDQADVIRNAVDEFQIKFLRRASGGYGGEPAESWLASWDCGRGRGSAHAVCHAGCDASSQASISTGSRWVPLSSLLGLLVDDAIIAIETMVVKMEEAGTDQGRWLRLESHRRANAGRHSRDHHRPDADWLRSFHSGRIRQKTSSGSSALRS